MWPFRKKSKPVKPPVDLNAPVTNPALVTAINAYTSDETPQHLVAVLNQLLVANFLVPVMMDEVNYAEPRMTGNLEMLEGSLIKVLFVSGPNDENIFPLFTDWDEMRAFAPNTPVEGRVMPARDAWKFIARDGLPAVVSPAGMTVDLTVEQVADLASRFDRLPNLSVFG